MMTTMMFFLILIRILAADIYIYIYLLSSSYIWRNTPSDRAHVNRTPSQATGLYTHGMPLDVRCLIYIYIYIHVYVWLVSTGLWHGGAFFPYMARCPLELDTYMAAVQQA